MQREELKEQLRTVRDMMDRTDAEQKKDCAFAGEVREIPVNGELHKLRCYFAGEETAPVYLDIHGGGMCWGAMENCDLLARSMTQGLRIHVLSLDYPLVPDTEYPEPVEYLYGTIRELVRHAEDFRIDPWKMMIGGRSAGGNLATVMTILAAERKEFSFIGQILDHPWLDLDGRIPWETRLKDAAITEAAMKGLALGYATPERQREPTCTPLNTPAEILRKLPPAIIQTCEKDPLNVEGERYAELLSGADVPVLYGCFPEATHGFSEQPTAIGRAGRAWIMESIVRMNWL